MSNLIVFTFDNEAEGERMWDTRVSIQKQQIISLEDAAVVIRRKDGKVKVKQAQSLVGAGASGGSFWGLLIGLLFLAPWLGLAIGVATGAIAGGMTDVGVDDKFIKEVDENIELGHSALFLLVTDSTPDKVMDGLTDFHPTVYQTSLSEEDEAKMRAAFGEED